MARVFRLSPLNTSAGEVAFATVAAVALPEVAGDQSKSNFIAAVTTSAIDAKNKLVGFQGDFTFDERVVTFQSPPVQKAGIPPAAIGTCRGTFCLGAGPDQEAAHIGLLERFYAALSGSGTLFELRMTRVSKVDHSTPLIWAAAPTSSSL